MQTTYDQSIIIFSKMKYEDKKKKVISMLEILKEKWNIFDDFWNLVNITENVSESILEMIYQIIVKAMFSIKSEEMEKALVKLEWIKTKIEDIKQKEENEKNNSDKLLDDF